MCSKRSYSYTAHEKKTIMLIVPVNAFGFFTGSGKLIPFSVDLSNFSRSFRVESNTTMKIYIGHDVLLINEVHNAIERNSFFYNSDHSLLEDHLLDAK